MLWLREWKCSIGRCSYPGKEGVVVIDGWLMKGHGDGGLQLQCSNYANLANLGGIPA